MPCMRRRAVAGLLLAALLAAACRRDDAAPAAGAAPGAQEPPAPAAAGAADPVGTLSPNARPEVAEDLRRELAGPFDPADGGGRAWLEHEGAAAPRVVAGSLGRFTIVYEAGELGVAEGGQVRLLVPPFLGWSEPQLHSRAAPGFLETSTRAAGVELRAALATPTLVAVEVRGRALRRGERIRFVYGAGPALARADSSAERDSRFWIYVDGDGDGSARPLRDPPALDVLPGAAAQLLLFAPSTARPGDRLRITLAVLDAGANAGVPFEGEIELSASSAGLELPARVRFAPGDRGRKSVEARALREGVHRLLARGPGGLAARSNPLVVSASGARVLWGDLHGHSNLSDGTGLPEDYFLYARDVTGLDVSALTDHDHWGQPLYLDAHPELWSAIRREVERFHAPGRFVTLLGFEWTSWLHGHRHVLYFDDAGEVLSSLDPRFETPAQLWEGLRGRRALSFAHHSAGRPVATNWAFAPDPVLEPVTEIVSVHGSSESADSPLPIRDAIAGNFVRDVLHRGARLGFIGSGDSHDGHPGCPGDPSHGPCGLAAILSEEATREGVLEALRARRVYATNGPRILLRVTLDGAPMGATLPGGAARTLAVEVVAPERLTRLEIVRGSSVVESVPCEFRREIRVERTLPALQRGDHVYVRAVQEDGGAAWSSPFFFD